MVDKPLSAGTIKRHFTLLKISIVSGIANTVLFPDIDVFTYIRGWFLRLFFDFGKVRIRKDVHFLGSFSGNPSDISLGDDVYIGRGVELIGPIKIGSGTLLNSGSMICNAIIGRNCAIGFRTMVLGISHKVGGPDKRCGENIYSPIKVGDGVWIGAGAIISNGITIGDGAVVGAGSIVTKDVPSNTLVVGNPAKVKRKLK
jgi:acetyltransferase-like isoleucine patch superfamily enzyme